MSGVSEILDAARPGADCRVAAAVRMQNRQRICSSGRAVDRHQNTAAARQHFENPSIMRLEAHLPHRAGQPQRAQVATGAL